MALGISLEMMNKAEAIDVCEFVNALFAKRGYTEKVVEVARFMDLEVWFVEEIQQEFPK